ncbi:hypothetical protein [Coleofasciculus sp.]|uniref:hypothetical protein n=1 Tax=Coleofasciculus sp. TaxID=3100458 RepID=UPI0039F94824
MAKIKILDLVQTQNSKSIIAELNEQDMALVMGGCCCCCCPPPPPPSGLAFA